MPNVDASHQRTPLSGEVDFTMMYIAHDAFTRDLRRMASACEGQVLTPGTLADWAMFTKQLHIRYTTEDISHWPKLLASVSAPAETAHPRRDGSRARLRRISARAHDGRVAVGDVIADLAVDHRCVAPVLPLGAHRHAMRADADHNHLGKPVSPCHR
jgi:hypothetical protein